MGNETSRDAASVLWEGYWAERKSAAVRNAIVEHYLYLLGPIVQGTLRQLPRSIDPHVVESAAGEGLIEAVERFDSGRKCSFPTYARRVMQSRVNDALRQIDRQPLSGSIYDEAYQALGLQARAVLCLFHAGKFRQREIAQLLRITQPRVSQIVRETTNKLLLYVYTDREDWTPQRSTDSVAQDCPRSGRRAAS